VPVLWDKQTGTIVNNESSEIIRMFTQVRLLSFLCS
jgi:putative glutathione S-transferase